MTFRSIPVILVLALGPVMLPAAELSDQSYVYEDSPYRYSYGTSGDETFYWDTFDDYDYWDEYGYYREGIGPLDEASLPLQYDYDDDYELYDERESSDAEWFYRSQPDNTTKDRTGPFDDYNYGGGPNVTSSSNRPAGHTSGVDRWYEQTKERQN